MQQDFNALLAKNTWTLTSLPPHRKAIGCKWVFRVKENSDGSLNKYKARLVAKGFNQKYEFDYNETFSPVVKPATIKVLLTLALTYEWEVQQIDINNAFLNGALEEEVYMMQPLGFENANKSLVCKLNRALYGLNQAPRSWYDKLHKTLFQFGFTASRCGHSLFLYNHQGITLYVLVYVDDILITSTSSTLIHKLISNLHNIFALKKLGKPTYFLGLEVKYQANGSLILTQTKYIKDLLSKVHMEDAHGVAAPMFSHCKPSKFGTDTMQDPLLYRSIVGAL